MHMDNSKNQQIKKGNGEASIKPVESSSKPMKSVENSENKNQHAHCVEPQPLQHNGDQKQTIQQETGGYEKTKEPTRYGDWEIAGRCVDF